MIAAVRRSSSVNRSVGADCLAVQVVPAHYLRRDAPLNVAAAYMAYRPAVATALVFSPWVLNGDDGASSPAALSFKAGAVAPADRRVPLDHAEVTPHLQRDRPR